MNTYSNFHVLPIGMETVCDICNRSRAHGNHNKCSKARQLAHAEQHKREKQHEQAS